MDKVGDTAKSGGDFSSNTNDFNLNIDLAEFVACQYETNKENIKCKL